MHLPVRRRWIVPEHRCEFRLRSDSEYRVPDAGVARGKPTLSPRSRLAFGRVHAAPLKFSRETTPGGVVSALIVPLSSSAKGSHPMPPHGPRPRLPLPRVFVLKPDLLC
jgi:hypothetical protein